MEKLSNREWNIFVSSPIPRLLLLAQIETTTSRLSSHMSSVKVFLLMIRRYQREYICFRRVLVTQCILLVARERCLQ